jgi:hypothetical protein
MVPPKHKGAKSTKAKSKRLIEKEEEEEEEEREDTQLQNRPTFLFWFTVVPVSSRSICDTVSLQ